MKTILFISGILFIINPGAFTQIKVDKLGDVGLGKVIFTSANSSSEKTLEIKSPNWDGGFVVDNTGNYGSSTFRPNRNYYGILGTTSHQWGSVHADHIYSRVITNYSDENLRINTRELEQPLDKLKKLNAVSYDLPGSYFKPEEFFADENVALRDFGIETARQKDALLKEELKNESSNQMGFMVADMKKVFPELVFRENNSDQYSINYLGLIPVLVESIKEQQIQIELQNIRIRELEKQAGITKSKKKWFRREGK